MQFVAAIPKMDHSLIKTECARLARSAEFWGAEPQGGALAELAQYLAANDIVGAMWVRDDLLDARNQARQRRLALAGEVLEGIILAPVALLARIGKSIQKAFPSILEIAIWLSLILIPVCAPWLAHLLGH